jgi:hypothetical protein
MVMVMMMMMMPSSMQLQAPRMRAAVAKGSNNAVYVRQRTSEVPIKHERGALQPW